MKNYYIVDSDGVGERLNTLARHEMIERLLRDIRCDIEVCKLEGLDYKEYLYQLKDIIDGFLEIEK